MGETKAQRAARDHARSLRLGIGDGLRRLREDEALTKAAVARAAGIDPTYVRLIEMGKREASLETLAVVAAALGAELSARVYPVAGPQIHDRIQGAMGEALLGPLHPRWLPLPEVPVYQPSRGVVDFLLADRVARLGVETELQSELRRLELQLRRHREKETSLPSSVQWRELEASAGGSLTTSRLLVLRSTRELRDIATTFEGSLRAAYPARTEDVVAALTTADAPWPGPGIVWINVDGKATRLMHEPPRGVKLGR
jgi:transcriptional regulator with XRE-family HTH domain